MRALIALAASAMLLAPVGALAQTGLEATLRNPARKSVVVLDGRVWTCSAQVCRARVGGRSQSAARECARVARKLGPLQAYRRYDAVADAARLETCNTGRVR